jgi:hypothetical protein
MTESESQFHSVKEIEQPLASHPIASRKPGPVQAQPRDRIRAPSSSSGSRDRQNLD